MPWITPVRCCLLSGLALSAGGLLAQAAPAEPAAPAKPGGDAFVDRIAFGPWMNDTRMEPTHMELKGRSNPARGRCLLLRSV